MPKNKRDSHNRHAEHSSHSSHSSNSSQGKHKRLPAYFRYKFLSESSPRRLSVIPLDKLLYKWKLQYRYCLYNKLNVVSHVQFGLLRWYTEKLWKLNSDTSQPIHKHLSATPRQMLIGFILVCTSKNEFQLLKENDFINLETDLVFFKRVDYSYLLELVIIDEKTKRKRRLLHKDAFKSPFNNLLLSPQSTDDVQIVMEVHEKFSHQYVHPCETIFGISKEAQTSNTLCLERNLLFQLFSINWYQELPVTVADDWALMRETCDILIKELSADEKNDKVREDWCLQDDVDLLPQMLDEYAIQTFRPKPHGLIKRHWIPMTTKDAVSLIRSTLPFEKTLNFLEDQNQFIVPVDIFYENGRLYRRQDKFAKTEHHVKSDDKSSKTSNFKRPMKKQKNDHSSHSTHYTHL